MAIKNLLKKIDAQLQLGDGAKNGVWMILEDPYGENLGLALKVVSTDSKDHMTRRQKALEKFAHKSKGWRERHLRGVLAKFLAEHVIVDWQECGIDDDEETLNSRPKPADEDPYDAQAVSYVLEPALDPKHKAKPGDDATSANNLIEQIDEFTRDASNFRLDPDLGKSESISK